MDLPGTSDRAAAVEAMFDRISPRYDMMNRLMTFGIDRSWRRRAVASLGVGPGALVLDLACGTGDLAREALAAGARVLALDFSAGMLRQALARGIRCDFVRGDALRLPLADQCCDAVVSGFAVRNFVDPKQVFMECARVLKSGGGIALLEVDCPSNRVLRLGHRMYFCNLVPLLGRLLSEGDAYAYLPSSVAYLPEESRMFEMLREAGFEAIAKRRMLGGSVQLITGRRLAGRSAQDG